jgi:hypothetical protein
VLPRARGAERLHKQRADGEGTIDAYQLLASIDKQQVAALISEFEGAVKRRIDRGLAEKLREQILEAKAPSLNHKTIQQLARWCKTENPIYRDGMIIAQKISAALFGEVLDRERLGT